MSVEITPARREFKKRFGQANHFLITTLIGLEQIDQNTITSAPSTFTAAWNPRDWQSSAFRSKAFVLKSFLGWAVESLEMYLTEIYRKPKVIDHDRFEKIYSKAGQSIYKKAVWLGEEIGVSNVLIALVEVLVTWRNQVFHYDVDNEIRAESISVLKNDEKYIRDEFSGLEVDRLLQSLNDSTDFTFKETASLIHAVQLYVESFDRKICNGMDFPQFAFQSVEVALSKSEKARMKYGALSGEKRNRYIDSIIREKCCVSNVDQSVIDQILLRLQTSK